MKRKIPFIIVLVIILAFAALGCNDLPSFDVEGVQDTSYIVLSNGGSAVQYGNYVYFINGYNGYDDIDATANKFGDVEKGAIYRAELEGKAVDKRFDFAFGSVTKKTFQPQRNDKGLKFKTTSGPGKLLGYETDTYGNYIKDDSGEYIPIRDEKIGKENADVQRIGPKKVGTTGFEAGGIFIFDDYIFYASPNNSRDKNGNVQTHKTDFFRAKLNGSQNELIYTTEGDGTAAAYMFYKYNGCYYLVVNDEDKVKSVKMEKDKKIDKKAVSTIGEGVTAVHFPNKGTYYTGMPENTTDDLVYFTRTPIKTDSYSDYTMQGNVLEAKRPDGSNSTVIAGFGKTSTILCSNNGMFFYRVDNTVHYTRLSGILGGVAASGKMNFDVSDYSSIKCINPNPLNADDVYAVGIKSEGIFLVDSTGDERQLYNVESVFVTTDKNYLYFTSGVTESSGIINRLLRIDMFILGATAEAVLDTDSIFAQGTFKYDVLDDFVMYFADIDSDASAYAFFKELSDLSSEGLFVGYRVDADSIPEESLYPPEE